jgi:hypothetical protein
MELFSGYDNMMLGQADTEINEPITSQGCEMPSPYESQEVEEETFETLKAGGGIFDGMGAETAAPAAPAQTPLQALQAQYVAAGAEAAALRERAVTAAVGNEASAAAAADAADARLAVLRQQIAAYGAQPVARTKQWIKGVPNVAVIAGVAVLAAYFLLRKKG